MKTREDRPLDARRQEAVEAVALFSVLMQTRHTGDLQEAAAAQRQLDCLGVVVQFRRDRGRKEGGKP